MSGDTTLELLTKRVGALYVTDERGRLVGTNEWDARPAPRFHLMLTAHGLIRRFRGDLSDDLIQALESICRREPRREPGSDLPVLRRELLQALGDHGDVEKVWCGPAYRLPATASLEAAAVAIDDGNARLLDRHFPDWLADIPHRQPFMAAVEGGEAVSICASVRISQDVHCAGVETHADHRRRGHALRAVAGWAMAVRALGATPFYSTAWENIASQSVARGLAFEMVGVDFHVT
jgi:hypothetical protein